MRTIFRSFIAFALFASVALAADPVDPAKDPDFVVQGEYAGQVNTGDAVMEMGIRIIALGDGKFHGVAYPGGLPGAGWLKDQGKVEADSTKVNDVVTFKDPKSTAVAQVKDGALVVSDPKNPAVQGKLAKVMRKSPTLGAKPPEGAIVLFDGKEKNDFNKKATDDGLLPQGVTSKQKFGSCTVHLEFLLPFEPKGRGQGRGNSGIYVQGRYEVQILDSFGLAGKNNEAGGIYTISDPAVNMCFPPLSWQTYDIEFTAAEFDAAGKKTKSARMTVKHNGVLVQDNVELTKTTTAAPNGKEGAEPGAIHLQDHGHPVRFQNVWVVPK